MTKSANQNFIDRVWNFFSSVRLTIILLIILAVTSVFGTVIPQQESALAIVYHSFWFRLIIGLLALNLIFCSLNRLPATLKRYRSRPSPDRSRPFENISPDREILIQGDMDQIRNHIREYTQRKYRHTSSSETGKGTFFYGDRGRFSYFGVYVVHLSFLLILIGATVGSLIGFEGHVNIPEGETVDSVVLSKTGDHEHKALGFQVRCDKFSVDYYEDGTPKEYRSDLTFLEGGQKVFQSPLLVNHPVTFRGITFYQSTYGTIVGDEVQIRISRSDKESASQIIDLKKGKSFELPDDKGTLSMARASSDLMGLGPAVELIIQPGQGKVVRLWLLLNEKAIREKMPGILEKMDILNPASYQPFIFSLVRVDSKYYTGLLVNRDPGLPLVWSGFILIMIGLFITFFTSHQQIWIRVTPENEKIRVSVAGRANKNPLGLERDLDLLVKEISSRINP